MSHRQPSFFSREAAEYAPLPTSEDASGRFMAGKIAQPETSNGRCVMPSNGRCVTPSLKTMVNMGTIDQPTTLRGKVRNFIQDPRFQGAIATLILVNALVLGMETDMAELKIWPKIETAFLCVFTLEFLVKIAVYGVWEYFRPTAEEACMNILDFLIVVLGVIEFTTEAILDGEQQSTRRVATLFRIFRLLRILRIFKIMRFLKQLYMLAFGLALAATAVAWVTVLMIFVLYVCSIILVRTIGQIEGGDPNSDFLRHNFETIPSSMFTLFTLMAQPDLTHYRAVIVDFPLFGIFLFVFVLFGSFGMIALLTGVIGESMFEKNQLRMMEDRKERDERRQMMLGILESMFDGVQIDGTGQATKDEIKKVVIPQVQELFEQENIHYACHEFDRMINVVDSGDGLLNRHDFCASILNIAEGVRPVSIIEIHYEVAECMSQLMDLQANVSTCLKHLESQSPGTACGDAGKMSATLYGNGNGNDMAAELRSLVLELRGDVQLIGQATQANAVACPTLAECLGQLACLNENVDKCLVYLEDRATAGTVGTAKSNSAIEGLLSEMHRDMPSLNLRSQPFIRRLPKDSDDVNLCGAGGISFDMLEAMVRETLEVDSVGEMDEEKLDCKLKAKAGSLAARLAHKMAAFPIAIPTGAGCAHFGLEKDHHKCLAATSPIANSELQRWITSQSIAAAGSSTTMP